MNSVVTRTPLYFVGWNYLDSTGVPLKRLLMNALSPFEVKGIVHQEVMAPEVDGIPVLQSDSFLALAKTEHVQAVLFIKDELSRTLWLRRGREAGIEWLDEGELLIAGSQSATRCGVEIDLGILKLPDAFDEELTKELHAYAGLWADATSNGIFRSYLQFLDSGVLGPLRSAAKFSSEHPLRQEGPRSIASCLDEWQGGLAWEIAPRRSSFLEQVLLMAGKRPWVYAYSGESAVQSLDGARHLKALMAPFGLHPMCSWFEAVEDAYCEYPVEGFSQPRWDGGPRFVRIDVARPAELASTLSRGGGAFRAWIRVGRTPRQLLGLLQRFPIEDLALDCDRPGPAGLQVRLRVMA